MKNSDRPRIALFGMGGTIAMVPGPHGALIPAKSAEDLVAAVPLLQESAEIEVFQVENLDSTDIDPTHWLKLISKIEELYCDFDGFVITHGTDTMAYTSGAVTLAFGAGLTKPIVFTGSQLPLIELGNDARSNLENTIRVTLGAIDYSIGEVMVVFGHRVLRATRTQKVSEAEFDAFRSPAFPELAVIDATGITFRPEARRLMGVLQQSRPPVKAKFDAHVLTIDVMPGLKPDLINHMLLHDEITDSCKALILRSLGSGNIPEKFLSVIQTATNQGIAVFIATKFVGGRALPLIYETGRRAVEIGASSTGDMTDVMVQVKLMWLLGMGIDDPQELQKLLLEDYAGEVTVPVSSGNFADILTTNES